MHAVLLVARHHQYCDVVVAVSQNAMISTVTICSPDPSPLQDYCPLDRKRREVIVTRQREPLKPNEATDREVAKEVSLSYHNMGI